MNHRNLFLRRLATIFLIGFLFSIALKGQNPVRVANAKDNTGKWRFESPRDEIAAKHWLNKQVTFDNKPTYALSGDGKGYAIGCWTKNVPVKENIWYEFVAHYSSRNVDDPLRSILARLLWQDKNGKEVILSEYPKTLDREDVKGWNIIRQVYHCPEGAVSAQLELVYRWDADGTVFFSDAELIKVPPVEPRKVKLATVYHRPKEMSTSEKNVETFVALTEEAGQMGADIVCLPEGITKIMTGIPFVDVAESVPGPTTSALGNVAKKYGMYIVAGIYERDGPAVYNTAILIGRDGKLAGKYRKVSLPRGEIQGGISPGNSFPVFETDFGKVGIMICWDVTFPETARCLAMNGAEIIMLPIWGGNVNLAAARAIENQVYLISSSYDSRSMKSAVFDREGKMIAEAGDNERVKMVEIDLNERKLWPVLGDLRNRIVREMPPARLIPVNNND